MENNSEELKRTLYNYYFDYTEKDKGACFYAQHVMQYINGVESIIEEQQKEIERLKQIVENKDYSLIYASEGLSEHKDIVKRLREKLDKKSKINEEINQTVTDLNKPLGLCSPSIFNPDSK